MIERSESGAAPSMLDRMDMILDAVEEAGFLTLSGVMERTGLPRSTAHRLLSQMEQKRWLFRVGTNYELGVRLFNLGTNGLRNHWFYRQVLPTLQRLQLQTGYVVHLCYLDGPDVVYWDKLGSGRFLWEVPTRIGGFSPAHTTAVGKALLAAQPDGFVESLQPFAAVTERSVTGLAALKAELTEVHKRGYAAESGECVPGLGCYGTTVTAASGDSSTARRTTAAISVCLPADKMDNRLVPVLLAARKQIVQDLRVNPMTDSGSAG